MKTIRKVLIANRGEIAVRVAQTLQEMGITAVAVYSEPDRTSLHVARADEAYPLDGVTPGESYLSIHKMMDVARECHADAVHPGYGFLSENAEFAEACAADGLTFIGPSPNVIRAMGDKVRAKKLMADAGVPVVPGWAGDPSASAEEIRAAAESIGYPVLLKAAAGGGGRGMRVVREAGELGPLLEAARHEANSAFGDARVFVEKYIDRPRHIEFQIFGDQHGNVVHLFERECSIQRRYQKIVEESPAPSLPDPQRAAMGEAAVQAARTLGYTNAGTVEFIVDESGNYYFLEVNTRLQVEHPVTELVVRHDLVRAQLLVASGERLPFSQDDLRQDGHAIECRIYAEDPDRGFVPAVGNLDHFSPPHGPNIRVDTGVQPGSDVTIHYDPMLAKLIVWGASRDEALRRMDWALSRFVVLGVTTNVGYLRDLIRHPEFQAARVHTHFLDEQSIAGTNGTPPDEAFVVAGLAASRTAPARGGRDNAAASESEARGPWMAGHRWRNV